jgi:hypothetical protein
MHDLLAHMRSLASVICNNIRKQQRWKFTIGIYPCASEHNVYVKLQNEVPHKDDLTILAL